MKNFKTNLYEIIAGVVLLSALTIGIIAMLRFEYVSKVSDCRLALMRGDSLTSSQLYFIRNNADEIYGK